MPRSRTIVGIGEAYRADYPDRIEPGGTALLVALQAPRFGHTGVPVSRIGQDPAGDELVSILVAAGVDQSHVQRDPDHPTGRLIVRTIGQDVRVSLDPHSAYDELQWDFDLSDVAPLADAVICGQVGCRSSQARTVIERFLDESTSALRMADLAGLPDHQHLRSEARGILERVDVACVDEPTLRALVPGIADEEATERARRLARSYGLNQVAVRLENDGTLRVAIATSDEVSTMRSPISTPAGIPMSIAAVIDIALCHGLLAGWSVAQCLDAIEQAIEATIASEDAMSPLPSSVIEGTSS